MDAMLRRGSTRFRPATIIDVGASTGSWSMMAKSHWPNAQLVCIEADERHREKLEAFCASSGAKCWFAMADQRDGIGNFLASPTDPFGGCGSTVPAGNVIWIDCRRPMRPLRTSSAMR